MFYGQAPVCSLLFNVDNRGYVAVCAETMDKDQQGKGGKAAGPEGNRDGFL